MIEISYLLAPLVGGVIGYITNDIAIRMLFRPHSAKYIMGIHIPFTPGIFHLLPELSPRRNIGLPRPSGT